MKPWILVSAALSAAVPVAAIFALGCSGPSTFCSDSPRAWTFQHDVVAHDEDCVLTLTSADHATSITFAYPGLAASSCKDPAGCTDGGTLVSTPVVKCTATSATALTVTCDRHWTKDHNTFDLSLSPAVDAKKSLGAPVLVTIACSGQEVASVSQDYQYCVGAD